MDKPKCRLCGERHYSYETCSLAAPKRILTRHILRPEDRRPQLASAASKPGTRLPQSEKTVQDRALTPEHIPSRVTKPKSVTKPRSVTKRGRPPKGDKPMSAAEKQKAYRARKKLAK